jgi:hypothetical protein
LSEPLQGFEAIRNATREIEAIEGLYGGEVLLNEDFEARRFESELVSE